MALDKLTNVSIAFIYREGSFKSETTSQTFLGETLVVLEEQNDWFRIRQEDGYEGWIAGFFVVDKPLDWDNHEFYHHGTPVAWIFQSPDRQSSSIRDITLLSKLPALDYQEGWVQVLLPDGTQGWIEKHARTLYSEVDVERLVQTAFSFQGTQYFWAGRSPKGFDCSGFVQTVFGLNGLSLPRDAYQQAEIGEKVDDNYANWQIGDLIYFTERGDRITHIAISLGDGDFIHASGYVKINSINPDHKEIYIEKYAAIFTKTMRVL